MALVCQARCCLGRAVRWRYSPGKALAGSPSGRRVGLVVVDIHYKFETGHDDRRYWSDSRLGLSIT
jgi:hypothetical protein